MRKRILTIALTVFVSASMLSGCGVGNTAQKKNEAVQETTEKTENTTETENTVTKEAETKDDFVQDANPEAEEQGQSDAAVELDTSKELSGKHHIEIDIQGMGTIYAELDADSAPITVTNFIKLIQEDFYDGLTFHRIIDGFMMQGGDPMGNGTGGSKMNIKGEFAENGVENNLSHARGALSMARASAPDSASSQFFIVQTDSHYLDGKYAVFGYVTDGMDIVDAICKAAEPIDRNGTIEKSKQPIMDDIRIID